MNEYTSGFAIADQLEDTLLGYVMANRQLNEQARQFNRAQDLRDRTFAEDIRRFNVGEDRQKRYETLETDTRRANRAMLENIASFNRQRQLQKEYDRERNKYIASRKRNPFRFFESKGDFATMEDKYIDDFTKATGARPMPRMAGLPQFGTTGSIVPTIGIDEYFRSMQNTPENLLGMLQLQGVQ